ncbi:MAG TPA: DMT family transporter [Candidatus Kapabacteria bacterium]|nr:DMT family transporter [Candidatus Kapabacteria bacterium]
MESWKAESALFVVTIIWGATFLLTKIGLDGTTPSIFLLLRLSLALLISLIFFGKYLLRLNKTILAQGTVLGLLFGVGFLLQTYGLKFTSVSKTAFITGITVVITPFVYFLVKKKAIGRWAKVGVIIASIGLYIFTKPDFDNLNIGDILTLLSTIMWAFYITLMDTFTKGKSGMALTSNLVILQFFISTLLFIISFFLFDFNNYKLVISNSLLIAVAFNGILASFAVSFIHTAFQRYTTPVKAALIFSLEPLFAGTFAIIFINEILSTREYIGGGILFIGVMISELGVFLEPLLKKMKILNS